MDTMDVEALGEWFSAHVPGSAPPFAVEARPDTGASAAHRVTDGGGRSWTLRLPAHESPAGAGPRDLARTHQILVALANTAVPAPAPVAFCDDEAVIGVPFSVTDSAKGHVLRDPADATNALDEPGRRHAGESLIDTLAAIHAVDVDAAGLAGLASPHAGGPLLRQLERWHGEAGAAQEVTGRGVLLIEDMYRHLRANLPPAAGTALTLVHGDYRLDRVVVGDDGEVLAVLDWETASLGDPLVELGFLLAYWTNPGEQNTAFGGVTPSAAIGFPTRSEMASRYGERSGRDLSRLDFYLSFAYWKLACILEGVYARQMALAAQADRDDRAVLAPFADQVVRLAEASREAAA